MNYNNKNCDNMKGKIVFLAIASLFLISGVIEVTAINAVDDYQPLPDGNGIMQRFMNRIRDMLGICQGGCNLSELTGIMTYDENNFYIDTVELHFGPNWYIASAISAVDYDNDGELELVIDELFGLVNTTITVEGHYQSEDWMSVFTINGEIYREPGQPIWAAQHHWRWRNRFK
jgi:hypothetical protein